MIDRIRDALAPPKSAIGSETGYRRLLRWAALPVTDRRWAAPLAALALGFGLFVGVAIGPGATGTFATGAAQVIEIPGLVRGTDEGGGGGGEERSAAAPALNGAAGGEEASSSFAPIVPLGEEASQPLAGEESPGKEASPKKESSEPEKQQLIGTVVHLNPAAGSYTVAETGGVMNAVHAGKLPTAGTQVEVPIRTLANGTLAEAGERRKAGSKAQVSLAGIVTFVDADPAAPAYAVSNKGTSVLVSVHPDPTGAAPALPVLGAYASVNVEIENSSAAASSSNPGAVSAADPNQPLPTEPTPAEPAPTGEPVPPAPPPSPEAVPVPPPPTAPACAPDAADPSVPAEPKSVLWQRRASAGGAPFTHSDFAGIVTAVCPATAQLLISADDVGEKGVDFPFAVPVTIDTAELTVGESILASADIAADGSLTLTGLASDERLKGADDAKATQGDLVPAKAN